MCKGVYVSRSLISMIRFSALRPASISAVPASSFFVQTTQKLMMNPISYLRKQKWRPQHARRQGKFCNPLGSATHVGVSVVSVTVRQLVLGVDFAEGAEITVLDTLYTRLGHTVRRLRYLASRHWRNSTRSTRCGKRFKPGPDLTSDLIWDASYPSIILLTYEKVHLHSS